MLHPHFNVVYERSAAQEFVSHQKSKNEHEKFQHAELGVKNHGTTSAKRRKLAVLVNFILERVTNKVRVPSGNVMTNRWIQDAQKLNKRVLPPKKNKWYRKS